MKVSVHGFDRFWIWFELNIQLGKPISNFFFYKNWNFKQKIMTLEDKLNWQEHLFIRQRNN